MTRAAHQLLTSSGHTPFITDRAVATAAVFPSAAALEIDFFEYGYSRSDTSLGVVLLGTEWANETLNTVTKAALYEIRLTVTSGSAPTSGDSVATWLSMVGGAGGSRKWGLSRSSLGSSIGAWLIEIRSAATALVLTSATYSVTASVSSP